MLSLLKFIDEKYSDLPFAKGPNARESSPVPGISTLIMRAPSWLRIIVLKGPARTRDKSTITTPCSNRLSGALAVNPLMNSS